MQQFDVDPGAFNQVKKKVLIRLVPILLVLLIAGIAITSSNTSTKEVNIWPYFIPLMCGMVGFGLYRGLNKQKGIFESYKLTINKGMLLREQLLTPSITMRFEDVTEILKAANGSLIVKGKNSNANIVIPLQVNNYAQLEAILSKIKPLTVKSSNNFWGKYAGFIGACTAATLMVLIYVSYDKVVVGVSGVALISLMSWSFYKIRVNKNVDQKTKRTSWYLILVLLSVIAIVYSKLVA